MCDEVPDIRSIKQLVVCSRYIAQSGETSRKRSSLTRSFLWPMQRRLLQLCCHRLKNSDYTPRTCHRLDQKGLLCLQGNETAWRQS
ncbi:hypothetical protein DPMN_137507 [Dreissena polymorpha]|uniref:Uncharacterized protein n=1 Tax=Dreissena polymorpha TaxID=45954 RepID=A0A9D4G4V0_DREPO|nr:hypothetical protein DPMN_137507 [Dreissena polymorpha]